MKEKKMMKSETFENREKSPTRISQLNPILREEQCSAEERIKD